ncbi:MAG: hypothetical protein ACRCTJ_05290 [Brevinema sp.]
MYHQTYWYIPSESDIISENTSSKRIHIPKENLILSATDFDQVLRKQYRIYMGREVQ